MKWKSDVLRPVLTAAVLCPVLVGCTSWKFAEPRSPSPPGLLQQPVPPTAALVCVVRTSVLAQAVTFPTHDDGVLVGATRGPGHFCYLAEPGEHVVAIEADEVEKATLTAVAGQRYFLKQEVDNILGYVKCRAVWLAEGEAMELLDDTAPEVLVGVPGSEKLPADPPFAPAIHGAVQVAQSHS